jgi:hypothetical protein
VGHTPFLAYLSAAPKPPSPRLTTTWVASVSSLLPSPIDTGASLRRTVANSADQHRAKPLPCSTEPPAHAPAHVPFLGGLHYSAPGPAPSTTVRAIGRHGWHTMNPPKQSHLDRAPPDQHALPCLTDAPTQPAPASTAPALDHWPHPVAMAALSAPRAPGHPTTFPTTPSSAPIRGHDLVSVYPLIDCFRCR